MQHQLEDRIFVNESGNQVKYKRVVCTGYLNGNLEKIELPISKDQAVLYKAMQSSSKPVVNSMPGGEVEVNRNAADNNGSQSKNWLDD